MHVVQIVKPQTCLCALPDVNAAVDGAAMTLGDELSAM